jgi:hypothetical protein
VTDRIAVFALGSPHVGVAAARGKFAGSRPIKYRLTPRMCPAFPVEKLSSLILRKEPFELFHVDQRRRRFDLFTLH